MRGGALAWCVEAVTSSAEEGDEADSIGADVYVFGVEAIVAIDGANRVSRCLCWSRTVHQG